jgi:hypothetical protein
LCVPFVLLGEFYWINLLVRGGPIEIRMCIKGNLWLKMPIKRGRLIKVRKGELFDYNVCKGWAV